MRPSSFRTSWHNHLKKIRPYLLVFLAFIIIIGILLAANYTIAPRLSGGEDLLVPWMGSRAYLFDQVNPYSAEFARDIQIEIYGHPAKEGEYPYRLDIPFYLLVFYFPFAFIEDFNMARALWMSFSEIALFGVGILSIHLAEWKISRLNLTLFFSALFFSFYGFYPLMVGSSAIFTAFILLLALLALREKWDKVLAILLIFGATYLADGGLLFLLIIFILITSRRGRVFSALAMSLIAILGFSLIIFPSWILSFASSLLANLRAEHGILFSEVLQIWYPDKGVLVADIIKWISILILILEWNAARKSASQHVFWLVGLSLAITPFLGVRITSDLYPFLFFPLALIFKNTQDRWRDRKWGVSLVLFLLPASWIIFWRVPHAFEILTYLLPLLLVLFLYWIRWWVIRPPRTWADKVTQK